MWTYLAFNPLLDAYRQSDFIGKLIFLGLMILSLTTWSISIIKWRLQKKAFLQLSQFPSFFPKIHQNPLGSEPPFQEGPLFYLYRTLKKQTVELLNKNRLANEQAKAFLSKSDIETLSAHLATETSVQTRILENQLYILSTIVTLAPFLGLLGTVWGILITFSELQTHALSNANSTVMGGLAMALGTTVIGLVVAIPALLFYTYLKSTTQRFSSEIEDCAQKMLSSVELHYKKIDLS